MDREPRDYNRKGAYQYLPEIRKLLAEGKQAAAEALAQEQFMGLQSSSGDRKVGKRNESGKGSKEILHLQISTTNFGKH